eukprot:30988-Pelagococcus_subviridis.AAC.2
MLLYDVQRCDRPTLRYEYDIHHVIAPSSLNRARRDATRRVESESESRLAHQNQKLRLNDGVLATTRCHHPFGMNSESSGPSSTSMISSSGISPNFGYLESSSGLFASSGSIGENAFTAPFPPRRSGYRCASPTSGEYSRTDLIPATCVRILSAASVWRWVIVPAVPIHALAAASLPTQYSGTAKWR